MADLQGQFLAPDADILPPSNDRIFKVLLTHNDAKRVLIDIISAVIEQKVTDVQIRNVELPKPDVEEKGQRFDVNCTIENGDQVEVEMHSTPICKTGRERKRFFNKCTYFLTDLHSSQKSRGKEYHKLVRTYQVTFTSHPVYAKHPDFVSRFTLRDEKGRVFTNQINQIIIELSKLNDLLEKPVEQLTVFEKWLLFLRFAPDSLQRNKINAIIKEKEEIGMASAILQAISKDEKERAILRSQKKYEMDLYSDVKAAERKFKKRIEKETERKVERRITIKVEKREHEKWQGVVAAKDKEISNKDAVIAQLRAELEKR